MSVFKILDINESILNGDDFEGTIQIDSLCSETAKATTPKTSKTAATTAVTAAAIQIDSLCSETAKATTPKNSKTAATTASKTTAAVTAALSNVDLITSCHKRTLKITLTRVEESADFSETLKKELEELKVKREWEGQEWEVEEILDYSWCKLTVNFYF